MVKPLCGTVTWRTSDSCTVGVSASVSRLSAPKALASRMAGADRFRNLYIQGNRDVFTAFHLSSYRFADVF
jgi:hypothetical protein